MNWKLKGLAQSALSLVPGSTTLNYWGQRFITRAHSDLAPVVDDRLEKARWFVTHSIRHGSTHPARAHFFEFGAGWNLTGALTLYCMGVNRQTVVDLRRCARLDLINRVILELNRPDRTLPRRPGALLNSLDELKHRFGIDYRAPADARRTGFPADSVDCITNTYTLEHIPCDDLRLLLGECRRILKPGGMLLSMIDYQDHYSYRDPRISVYNFLQYSGPRWRWFNSPLHYQNRLRHSQYARMFQEAGFETVSEELKEPSPRDLQRLRSLPLSPEFREFLFDDLIVLGSQMACRRPAAPERPFAIAEGVRRAWEENANGVVAH